MNIIETGIEGLMILEPSIYRDERGYFLEAYNKKLLADLGIHNIFVQDNESESSGESCGVFTIK